MYPPYLFSDHVGTFPAMLEFFRPFPISKEDIFPPCRNFSPFLFYMPDKISSFLTEGISANLMQKNAEGSSKNIPLTAEESSVICKAITCKCAENFSFVYSEVYFGKNAKESIFDWFNLSSHCKSVFCSNLIFSRVTYFATVILSPTFANK